MAKKEEGVFRTRSAKQEEVDHKWHLVDASGQTVGRLATRVATLLRGKHKASFTPHVDTGDFVVVVNAAQVKMTGKRMTQKEYYHNTLYPGGARHEKFSELMAKHPERIISEAVKGMLPKNSLGKKTFKKLKVYAGAEHEHAAQNPVTFQL
ncbi:MAG TPA: 50S ribosomal protein L13 [Candidatus Kapabacteria bacterium]|nr:50S ribosomal protein L13 [Candidatus Kapabacteria bacterium]